MCFARVPVRVVSISFILQTQSGRIRAAEPMAFEFPEDGEEIYDIDDPLNDIDYEHGKEECEEVATNVVADNARKRSNDDSDEQQNKKAYLAIDYARGKEERKEVVTNVVPDNARKKSNGDKPYLGRRPKSETPCFFYKQGHCTRGNNCEFKHDKRDYNDERKHDKQDYNDERKHDKQDYNDERKHDKRDYNDERKHDKRDYNEGRKHEKKDYNEERKHDKRDHDDERKQACVENQRQICWDYADYERKLNGWARYEIGMRCANIKRQVCSEVNELLDEARAAYGL